jgi:hypothetical protein
MRNPDYAELQKRILESHREERQALIGIGRLYNLATLVAKKYEEFESGTAHISYHAGATHVTVSLRSDEGKHPLREALILIDEILYEEEGLKETEYPAKMRDHIYWYYTYPEDVGYQLVIEVQMRTGGGCRQRGTGKYAEIMEWVCD